MSGAEEETKRAVGRRRDGSSASVSVSPAQSWPGAVDIVFAAAPVVRRGASAMLLLDGDHVQIKIPVTCLENGTTGQTIQAADKDHHQVYTAQVVSENLLRGRL